MRAIRRAWRRRRGKTVLTQAKAMRTAQQSWRRAMRVNRNRVTKWHFDDGYEALVVNKGDLNTRIYPRRR